MDSLSDVSVVRGSFGGVDGQWDCGRELRALREATARSRTEEANALRRNVEEAERCAVRRHTEESVALQTFLAGFHEAIETRLERQRVHVASLLEALEQRMEG